MAHFAKVINGIVEQVIVADQEFIDSGVVGNSSDWVETFKDKSARAHYAATGYTYDSENDRFIPPQPFDSWTLNEESVTWEAPVPMPVDSDGSTRYTWNEETESWDPNE